MTIAAASLLRRCGGSVRRCYHGFHRSLAAQTHEIDSQRQKQQLPWLLLSSPDNPESRYLYDLTGDDRKPIAFNREIHLPQIAGRHLMGSSQGYLFSVDPNTGDVDATDPFTGARLPVPSTAALPNMIGVVRDPNTGNLTHYVSNPYLLVDPDPPGIDSFVFCLNNPYRLGSVHVHASTGFNPREVQSFSLDEMSRIYFSRAILSPSLDTVVVVHRGLVGYGSEHLAFSRIGGGSSWTALRSPEHRFEDVIFHKGRLHAVSYSGRLSVFDEDLDNPSDPPMRSRNEPLSFLGGTMKRSVVESPDGEDLFLVFRELAVADNDEYPPRTECFKVYKFDEASRKWKRVKNIGDIALFLGFNHSMSLSASDYPGGIIKPNCIYFTDEYSAGYMEHPDWVGDTGVYSLKDGSFRFYELRDGSQQLHWPPPIWFMPTAR